MPSLDVRYFRTCRHGWPGISSMKFAPPLRALARRQLLPRLRRRPNRARSRDCGGAPFAMVVVETRRMRWGEVVGRLSVGVAAPAGTPIRIVRQHERPLRARI